MTERLNGSMSLYFNGLRLPVELVVSSSGTDETLLYLPVELRVGPSDCAKAYIVDPSSEGVTLKKLSEPEGGYVAVQVEIPGLPQEVMFMAVPDEG